MEFKTHLFEVLWNTLNYVETLNIKIEIFKIRSKHDWRYATSKGSINEFMYHEQLSYIGQ